MLALLSVYTDPQTAQAWRASVKALGMKQGPALEEALRMWLELKRAEIAAAIQPSPPTRLLVRAK